jgi:hypothetical protein
MKRRFTITEEQLQYLSAVDLRRELRGAGMNVHDLRLPGGTFLLPMQTGLVGDCAMRREGGEIIFEQEDS